MKTSFIAVFMLILSGCATHKETVNSSINITIDNLIENIVIKKPSIFSVLFVNSEEPYYGQPREYIKLQNVGEEGIPYIVGHLGDYRKLAMPHIELENKAANSFEEHRIYGPEVVHDVLSAILNQITGQYFEDVHNGASAEIRDSNKAKWQEWCVSKYPKMASACLGRP